MLKKIPIFGVLSALVWLGNPAVAFLVGVGISVVRAQPWFANAGRFGTYSLQTAIVLLGLKLDASQMIKITYDYSLMVACYVVLTLSLGILLGRLVNNSKKTGYLISAGTAICGGTAVAALSPVIDAKAEETGIALTLIFLLNAAALIAFPYIGSAFEMTQEQFGVWVALAVHDTSSVVATSAIYGEEAAKIATTVKLGRTLWLIPLIMVFSVLQGNSAGPVRIPLFVILFTVAAVFSSTIALPEIILETASVLTNTLLVIALFCIGSGISRQTLRNLKGTAVFHTIGLWLLVMPLTLFIVLRLI
ncbi:MAG: putative sulfate exporter family transporter [Porticoccaceae bacterium]|nr:putative sulfate exporter family transporter [Porticoccaceae bacterium]MDG1474855.1 putative sulfate exporter family transporter [Porticoccaceae bacterium]